MPSRYGGLGEETESAQPSDLATFPTPPTLLHTSMEVTICPMTVCFPDESASTPFLSGDAL